VPAGMVMVGFDADLNRSFVLVPEGAPVKASQRIEASIEGQDWRLSKEEIAPGPVSLTLHNPSRRNAPLAIYVRPGGDDSAPPLTLGSFLNGNRLLSNQTFRNLFRAETLATGEGVGVRDVTLLFTDLKGSTELYERVGDLKAFALVQQHFEHLRRAVQEQEGAVIKTIGDAVMASFVKPQQAVRAALAMFREIEEFNRTRGKRELILKIGMHRGHSIAVTLNERLDYFGQTVNLAARVQGVANADEICLTEDVYKIPEVQAALKGMPTTSESPRLKGIADEVPIRRVQVARAGAP
jgi:class 3 adenylate cyclase